MILLLTGCINPNGMAYTSLSNQEERKKQYVKAINFYLSNTNYPVIFTENSGTDISSLFQDKIEIGRMEYLTFHGNQNKEYGKGYGECEIIEYTFNHSKLILTSKDHYIIKITGRLIIKNIAKIIRFHRFFYPPKTVFCAINSDFSFPDSRFVIAPIKFWEVFLNSKDRINDSKGYFFEHALCDTLKKEKEFPYSPFLLMPYIEGMSGSTGEIYTGGEHTLSFAQKYLKYTLSQRHKFIRRYR